MLKLQEVHLNLRLFILKVALLFSDTRMKSHLYFKSVIEIFYRNPEFFFKILSPKY